MSTHQVIDKIIEDAKAEAGEILATHEKEASRIKTEYAGRLDEKKELIEKDVAERRNTHVMRAISQHRLDLNMKETAHRRELFQNLIGEAVSKLSRNKEYAVFLKDLIKKSGEREGTLSLSKNDFSNLRADLEKFIQAESMNFKITADPGISAGLVIKHGSTSYIGSVDIVLELLSDEIAIEISKAVGILGGLHGSEG